MRFELLYPERRTVSGSTIEGWYSDAVANGEIAPPYATEVRAMAMALQDVGHITVGKTNG